jgi:glycosyltransferase involved in cell wall biosynthesis
MIVRNAVWHGYPFLEAIRSVLPICDEFLVSDGHSHDGTWEALERLRDRFPETVRLFRDEWRGRTHHGEILATMTNVLKARCAGEYCLNVQANEVFADETAREVRELPELFPAHDLFKIPFCTILGSRLAWTTDFRGRLFRNLPFIRSATDAFDCGYDPRRFLLDPRGFLERVVGKVGVRTWYTTRPVYRYRALFPVNYLRKITTRLELFTAAPLVAETSRELAHAQQALREAAASSDRVAAFWARMRVYFDTRPPEGPTPSPRDEVPRRMLRELRDAPGIIAPLLDRWEYDLPTSLAALG